MSFVQFRLAALSLLALAVPGHEALAQDKVVHVYSSRSHYGSEPVFAEFTKRTGIRVEFFSGNNNEVFERLRAEGPRTKADLLISVDAGNLWNAARAGLLAPIQSPTLAANVPAHLRDPENRWFGIAVRARTIMYSTERVKPAELSTYAALGDPKWKGRLGLRSSNNIYNQSLLASWIKRHGEAKVEGIVKGWIANQPVIFDSDSKLLEAIAAGQIDVGITNSYYLARLINQKPGFPVAPFWADQSGAGVHVNISGAGVTAHAKNRDHALALLEFLTSPEAQRIIGDGNFEYPVNPAVTPHPLLATFGTFKADDIGTAAAGEHQAAAVRLADRVGYR
ncbi:MAG: extracellular solute-binding protein [Gemmatimonadales bacterium]|nr:extracellular solute-binding protein [Gemmatimonadales bacterium]